MNNNYLALLRRVLSLIASNPSGNAHQELQSIYYINNPEGKVALSETNQEVSTVTELCREFAKVLNNRDYTELDGKAEYYLYTIDHLIELIESKDELNTKKLFEDNKLKCRYEGCTFNSVAFNPNLDQAEVIYVVRASIIEATDKYLQSQKTKGKDKHIEREVPFERDYTLSLAKERGVWKISNFSAAAEARLVEP